jgi:hypothetical protein
LHSTTGNEGTRVFDADQSALRGGKACALDKLLARLGLSSIQSELCAGAVIERCSPKLCRDQVASYTGPGYCLLEATLKVRSTSHASSKGLVSVRLVFNLAGARQSTALRPVCFCTPHNRSARALKPPYRSRHDGATLCYSRSPIVTPDSSTSNSKYRTLASVLPGLRQSSIGTTISNSATLASATSQPLQQH